MRIWLPVVVRTLSRNTHFSKLRVCFRAATRLLSLKFHVWTSLYTFDLTGPLLCTIKSPWKQSFWLLFRSIVSQKVRLYKKKTAQLLFTIQFRHFSCSRLCSRLYPILLLKRHCLIITSKVGLGLRFSRQAWVDSAQREPKMICLPKSSRVICSNTRISEFGNISVFW